MSQMPRTWAAAALKTERFPWSRRWFALQASIAIGNLWISLVVPFTYVYDRTGEKRHTVQFRAAGIIAPTSFFFTADARGARRAGMLQRSAVKLRAGSVHQLADRPEIEIQSSGRRDQTGHRRHRTVSSSRISASPTASVSSAVKRPRVHSPDRLALEQLPDELDEREHQLPDRAPDVFRIGVPARRRRGREPVELLREGTRFRVPPRLQVGAQHVSLDARLVRGLARTWLLRDAVFGLDAFMSRGQA